MKRNNQEFGAVYNYNKTNVSVTNIMILRCCTEHFEL